VFLGVQGVNARARVLVVQGVLMFMCELEFGVQGVHERVFVHDCYLGL
jgi:hypothetical protein